MRVASPGRAGAWVGPDNLGLLADLYAFTMLEAYLGQGLEEEATFSLFCRKLARDRNYLVAAGLEQVLEALEAVRFGPEALGYLDSLGLFSRRTLDYLEAFRFTGSVFALEEGTPFFGSEPVLEVVAPLPMAQLLESWVLNQIHVQTLAASKAARLVTAAQGRPVADFGLRRAQGADAALKVARGAYLGGVASTSNVLAGQLFGIPVVGTMAHSFVQAHDSQLDAFRAFARTYPRTVLLVDTYDTLGGVRDVLRLAAELGPAFQVSALRLDSGDLLELSRAARALLDRAGLRQVELFASGGLDERQIARLVAARAPITGFGVGTALAVSDDAPSLDVVYKLVAYAGRDRIKLSTGKVLLPGRKQVFRVERDEEVVYDLLAGAEEDLPGRPLLREVMRAGRRTAPGPADLAALRRASLAQRARLPSTTQALAPAPAAFPVVISEGLRARHRTLTALLGGAPPPADGPGPLSP